MPTYVNLTPGDPAPWFRQRSFANPRYVFDVAGGRYIVLCFFGSATDAHSQAAIEAVLSRRHLFDDTMASFFGVSLDPTDETEKRVSNIYAGYRYFWDFDGAISRLYGATATDPSPDQQKGHVRRLWVVLDPTLRVLRVVPIRSRPEGHRVGSRLS
jgi:peroxiredoxin